MGRDIEAYLNVLFSRNLVVDLPISVQTYRTR